MVKHKCDKLQNCKKVSMLKSANGNSSHGSGHHYNFNDQNVTDLPPLKEAERMTGIDHN